jgi:hypothetical protein
MSPSVDRLSSTGGQPAKSYTQLPEICENAGADFVLAQEARRELAALATATWNESTSAGLPISRGQWDNTGICKNRLPLCSNYWPPG